MKKKIILIIFVTLLCSCRDDFFINVVLSGNDIQRTYEISDFSALFVSSNVQVVFCDTIDKIVVQTDECLIDHLEISQKGSRLSIGYPTGVSWVGEATNLVMVPSQSKLAKIDISGACIVSLCQPLTQKKTKITLSGSSILNAQIEAENVELNASGSSLAELNGSIHQLKTNLSGASILSSSFEDNKYTLTANTVSGTLSGSSVAFLHSDGTISCTLSGASIINYSGTADVSGCSCTGVGRLIQY